MNTLPLEGNSVHTSNNSVLVHLRDKDLLLRTPEAIQKSKMLLEKAKLHMNRELIENLTVVLWDDLLDEETIYYKSPSQIKLDDFKITNMLNWKYLCSEIIWYNGENFIVLYHKALSRSGVQP